MAHAKTVNLLLIRFLKGSFVTLVTKTPPSYYLILPLSLLPSITLQALILRVMQEITVMNRNIIFFLIGIAAYGCYWENEETLYEEELCDTISVSFSEDILPILTNNCFSCHSNINAPDYAFGIALEDHQDVSASANLIIGAINHREGFPQMPKNLEKLDTCKIDTFEAWENQGRLDN